MDTYQNATPAPSPASTTAKGRYAQLEPLREPYLRRARDCAKVTLPYLYPPLGHTSTTQLYTPYQSLAARGVNNLASKLLTTMFPVNAPFFRYDVTEKSKQELEQKQGAEILAGKIDKAMSKYERAIQEDIESSGDRTRIFPAFKHIIVSGNVLLFQQKKDGLRLFSLDNYVVKRDGSGNVLEIITMERVSPLELPDDVKALVPHHDGQKAEDDLELYTWIKRTKDNWTSHQEINELVVKSTKGTYPLDKSPYIALRWSVIDGEDYGRGYVEDYIGDIFSLEGLSQAIVEGSAAAARVIIMVKPGSPTTMRAITKSPSGAVISGNKDDVGVLQLDKYADFRVSNEVITEISKRLSFAFLLNTAIQRQGERVTAEEVRYMAQELEAALGGTYSVLAQELQINYLRRKVYVMSAAGKLPELPKGFATPTIITGLEALGRGNDLTRLTQFGQAAAAVGQLPPPVLARFNIGEYLDRVGAALGIDMDGLIKTDDQVQQEQQQAQQDAQRTAAMPHMINAAGGVVKQAVANNGALERDAANAQSDDDSSPTQ